VVIDTADSLELARFVGGLHDLESGRLVCHPLPGGTGERWLAFDFLSALGKDANSVGAVQVGTRAWWWAELWLRAEQLRDVFVLRGHLLNWRTLERLLAVQRACGFRLWLIGARALGPAPRKVLDAAAPVEASVGEFVENWDPARCTRSVVKHADAFPSVPMVSFLTFRAACRRLLAPADFAPVDTIFSTTLGSALDWLRAQQQMLQAVRQLDLALADPQSFAVNDRYRPTAEAHARQEQADTWRRFLRELGSWLEPVLRGSASEATVRLRAVQVACFQYGLLLRLATPCHAPSTWPAVRPSLDEDHVARVRTLASPFLAALTTVALLTGDEPEVLARLRLDQLEGIHQIAPMPRGARSLVRAYVLERRAHGAVDDSPAFAERDGRASSPRVLRRQLQQVARLLGMDLPGTMSYQPSISDRLEDREVVVRLPILRLAVSDA
jgi:hypothetical protein